MAQYVADCWGDGCGWVSEPFEEPQAASDELAQHLHFTGHSGGSAPHDLEQE